MLIICLIVLSILKLNFSLASLVTGFSIATLNVLAGARYMDRALTKPNKMFVVTVFGSMIIRMVIILALILSGILFVGFSVTEFIFTVLGFYMFYLVIELKYLVTKVNSIKKI